MTDAAAFLPAEQRALPGAEFSSEPTPWPAGLSATGDAAVDQLMNLLADLPERDIAEHAATYERLHQGLREELDAAADAADAVEAPETGAGSAD